MFRSAAQRHGVFDRQLAQKEGVSNKRIRRLLEIGEIEQFSSTVFVVRGVGDPTLKKMLAATAAIPGSAVAARSTCHLFELGEPRPGVLDLWIPESARHRTLNQANLLRNRSVLPRDISRVDHIRTLSPPLALMQVGNWLTDEGLEHCLDDFLRSHDEAWLCREIERFSTQGRSGIVALRRVLNAEHRIAGVTDSWMERVLANLASQPGLPPVELQCEVMVEGKLFRVDVGFPVIKLGLEAHSRTFHFGILKENADNVRDLAFASVGWQLLYLTWHQLRDPDGFARQFGEIARRRAADLGSDF